MLLSEVIFCLLSHHLISIRLSFFGLQEEKQRNIGMGNNYVAHQPTEATALYSISKSSNGNKGDENNSKKDRHVCSHCGIVGHVVEKCYKPKGKLIPN